MMQNFPHHEARPVPSLGLSLLFWTGSCEYSRFFHKFPRSALFSFLEPDGFRTQSKILSQPVKQPYLLPLTSVRNLLIYSCILYFTPSLALDFSIQLIKRLLYKNFDVPILRKKEIKAGEIYYYHERDGLKLRKIRGRGLSLQS